MFKEGIEIHIPNGSKDISPKQTHPEQTRKMKQEYMRLIKLKQRFKNLSEDIVRYMRLRKRAIFNAILLYDIIASVFSGDKKIKSVILKKRDESNFFDRKI